MKIVDPVSLLFSQQHPSAETQRDGRWRPAPKLDLSSNKLLICE